MDRRSFLSGIPMLGVLGRLDPGLPGRLDALARLGDDDWAEVRRGFALNPGVAHMNCATLGATPRIVLDAIAATMREIEGNPAVNVFGPVGARMDEVRDRAAAFLGAGPDEVVLTRNTTEGMNMVASGIALGPDDEILTTHHEHPGGRVGWDHAAEHRGVRIVETPVPAPARDADQVVSMLAEHITDRTRVVSVSHVCTITGIVMPLARIAELTRPRGILLVCDGAQAPGMLPIDVRSLGVDTYASSSHKWMLAAKGSGLLYIRKAVQDRVKPAFLHSGYAPYTASSGTRNVAQIIGHGVAMAFHEAIGRDRVRSRCFELRERLRSGLESIPTLRLLTSTDPAMASGIVSAGLPESTPARDVAAALRERDIVVKVIPRPAYNGLRFSTHVYNSEADVDRLLAALAELVR